MDAQKYGYLTVGDTVRIFLYSGSKMADTGVKRLEINTFFVMKTIELFLSK